MRPLPASVLIVFVLTAAASSQGARSGVPTTLATRQVIVTAERVDRFSQWIEAVHDHEPGERDAALDVVLPWSGDELRAVWADSQFLIALMRNLKVNHFEIPQPRERVAIIYKPQLLQRMRAMACVFSSPTWVQVRPASVVFQTPSPCMMLPRSSVSPMPT